MIRSCNSAHLAQVGHSNSARATGVLGYDRAAAPHVRVDTRTGALNGRRSARGMAPQFDVGMTPARLGAVLDSPRHGTFFSSRNSFLP